MVAFVLSAKNCSPAETYNCDFSLFSPENCKSIVSKTSLFFFKICVNTNSRNTFELKFIGFQSKAYQVASWMAVSALAIVSI